MTRPGKSPTTVELSAPAGGPSSFAAGLIHVSTAPCRDKPRERRALEAIHGKRCTSETPDYQSQVSLSHTVFAV
jgi:hypothetical protein